MDRRRAQVWTASLLAVSTALASRVRSSRYGSGLHIEGTGHLLAHAGLFAVLTALLATSTRSFPRRWLYLAAVVLLGLGTEFEEHLRDGYPIESMDVLADCLGAAFGFAVANVWPGSLGPRSEG